MSERREVDVVDFREFEQAQFSDGSRRNATEFGVATHGWCNGKAAVSKCATGGLAMLSLVA